MGIFTPVEKFYIIVQESPKRLISEEKRPIRNCQKIRQGTKIPENQFYRQEWLE